MRTTRHWIAMGILALAALAAAALLVSTRWGPGIGGDATIYIFSARNLLDGIGLGLVDAAGQFRLIPYFAPFFPLVLAGLGALGLDLVAAAQGLNTLLFAGLVWLAGDVLLRFDAQPERQARWLPLAGAGLVLVSPILMPVYSWAMSEPLSNLLGFAGLVLLAPCLAAEAPAARRAEPAISALLVGLAFLTRYAGVAFLAAGALACLLFGAGNLRRRLLAALAYGLIGSLPMLAWLAVDLSQTATVASRSLLTGSVMAERLAAFGSLLQPVLVTWLVPASWAAQPPYPAALNGVLLAAGLALLAGWAVWILWETRPTAQGAGQPILWRWAALLVLFGLLYLAVILVVYVTTFPPITIDSRMTSPVHIALLLLVGALAVLTHPRWRGVRLAAALLPLLLVGLIGWYGWRTARIVQQNYETGLGYLSPAWQQSETVQALRALPDDAPLVSNEVTALLFLTGHRAYPLAEIYQDEPLTVFSAYGQGDDRQDVGQQLFRLGQARLVLFDSVQQQLEPIYGPRSAQRLAALIDGLRVLFRGSDGAIYAAPQP